MPFHLKKLLPRHYRILELCLDGKNRKDIAREVGLTPRAITNITNSPIFQFEYARRRKERQKQNDRAALLEIKSLREMLKINHKHRPK